MAPHNFMDMQSSAEIPVTESQTLIPEDIYQAALAASQHDSDVEDPYEPQPKRFLQTEHQKRQQKRDLEIRKLAWTLKKTRKTKETDEANHQRLHKQKQHPCSFEQMPSELVLKLMQHIHLRSLLEMINSSKINQSIFKANENAVFRGIEIEQFLEWQWLFGDSKHRTTAQSQQLKNAIISENRSLNPAAHGWAYDEQLLEILRMIDNNEFTGVRNVTFLQDMQDRVDVDIKATELLTEMKIARRTAMCLRSLSFQQPDIVNEENRTEDEPLVSALQLPWEARSHLINKQPASIRAEIRSILKLVIECFYQMFEEVVRQWVCRHHGLSGNQAKPPEMKKWMSKLMTGLVLETVIPQWYAEDVSFSDDLGFVWESSCHHLTYNLMDLLDKHDEGKVDAIQEVKTGVDFGNSIGLDVEGMMDGTLAGIYLDGKLSEFLQGSGVLE